MARMTLGERVLLRLSREPGSVDYEGVEPFEPATALELLLRVFPDFSSRVRGKKILDFGCGTGLQSVALVQAGAASVLGLDTNQNTLARASDYAAKASVSTRLMFASTLEPEHRGQFDLVISQNSMEHFPDPAAALETMKSALNPTGRIFITFGAPWYAPYGSHMQFFTKVPWVNLLFSEHTVMSVRSRFRNDGATHYEEVESGLCKMTVGKFERLIADNGLKADYVRYDCVKRLGVLKVVPTIRELFINNISCELERVSVSGC